MADLPQIVLDEEQQEVVGQFRSELHRLTDRMMSGETGVGANITKELFAQEMGYIQNIETNTLTIAVYLKSWLEQFRQNHVWTSGFEDSSWRLPLCTPPERSAIVVGAGPSLTDEQLMLLKDYKGYVICSNKALGRVLRYRVPDMVAVIHTTPEIVEHFCGELVTEKLMWGGVEVLASTCIHPDLTMRLEALHAKVRWFNASIPFKTGLDEYMHAMAPHLSTIDTGGNVGIFMCQLAAMMQYKTIGMLGMEHCLELNPKWTNEEAAEHAIFYAPEDDPVPFAMDQAFHNYMLIIQAWYSGLEGKGIDVYNLTPKGFLYIRRRNPGAMPYMETKEYVERFG